MYSNISTKKDFLTNGAVTPEHGIYLRKLRLLKMAVWLTQILLLAGIFLGWELAAAHRLIDAFITSQPSKVFSALYGMIKSGQLQYHLWITVYETILGFVIGTITGIIIAIFLWWSEFLSRVLEPYLVVLNSTPKVALGPLFIIWLGNGLTAIVSMALAISVITTILMVYSSFREVDPNKIKLVKTFGATKLQVLHKVVLPASVPTMIAALKVSVGLSMVGVIVGEFLAAKAGLGYLIIYGGQVFNMTLVMTSVIILAVIAAIMYQTVAYLESKSIRWRQ